MDNYHKKLLDELPSLGTWHHKISLTDEISTDPKHTAYDPEIRWKIIENYLPDDLSGKTVLDLGCNSGYFSMKMKKRGASKVVAVDNTDQSIRQTKFISKWFDVELEVIKEDVHTFCLTTDERFDYVIFLGLFYHCKYPVLILDRLAEMTKSRLFFQTVVIGNSPSAYIPEDDYSLDDRKRIINEPEFPKLFFIEKKFNNDLTNWWLANSAGVVSLLRSARFKIIEKLDNQIFVCEPDQPYGKVIYQKLVFPKYGKEDGTINP